MKQNGDIQYVAKIIPLLGPTKLHRIKYILHYLKEFEFALYFLLF